MIETIPVLNIGPILLVTIQVDLNDRNAAALQEKILQRIDETRAEGLLIDVTAVPLVDSYIGRVLSETARMAQVMNSQVVLVGIQPAVAATLTEMGMELDGVDTAVNVDRGLATLGYRLVAIDGKSTPQGIDPARREEESRADGDTRYT